jgi:hypothetical protein
MSRNTVSRNKKNKALPLSEGAAAIGTTLTTTEKVELRAYQLYELRDRQHGFAMQDWLRAEREMLSERA